MVNGNTNLPLVKPNPPALFPNSQVVIPSITFPSPSQSINSITVSGEQVARKYRLPPNSKVALFDETQPIFYLKETDESGNEISFKRCSYQEIEDPPEPKYLTVDEFYAALDEFGKKLKEDLKNE